jgi:hypothetical protein
MNYNAIEMREAIDKLLDRVKSPRFIDDTYYYAINQATKMILDDRTENIKRNRDYSVQTTQRLRNELSTLVPPTFNATIVGNIVRFPSDYYYLLLMQNTVDGFKEACRPITFNEKGLIRRNPFKTPLSDETYFTENNQGWFIELPVNSVFTKCEIDYLKMPNTVTIGKEIDKILSTQPLTIGLSYMVYEQAIHNNTTYYEGQIFTAANTVLTSGIVILNTKIINSDMPGHLHDEIIRMSAAIMNGTIENYDKQGDLIAKNEMS